MAWPQKPHYRRPKPTPIPDDEMQAVVALTHPRAQAERDVIEAAKRASNDYVVGTMVVATERAMDTGRLNTAIRGAAEIGRILGLYVDRSITQSVALDRIPALQDATLEQLRALASGQPMPDAPVSDTTSPATTSPAAIPGPTLPPDDSTDVRQAE